MDTGVMLRQAMKSQLWRVVEEVGASMMKVGDDEQVEEERVLVVCDDGARWCQMMHNTQCTTAAKHCATLRENGFA